MRFQGEKNDVAVPGLSKEIARFKSCSRCTTTPAFRNMLPRLLHSLIATFQHHWIPPRHTKHNALRYGLCEDVSKMAACIDFADANWQCGADFELWLSQDLFVKLCHEATCGGTLCLKCWACPLVPPIVWPHPPHPHWICQLEDFRLARPSN